MRLRCKEAMYLLHLYIDHQLTLKQLRVLEMHLASCETCSEELVLLEEMTDDLHNLQLVAEPSDMQTHIMQKVAFVARKSAQIHTPAFSPFRPSLLEVMAAVILATVATLVSLLQQPTVRVLLPIANGHDTLSQAYMQVLHVLTGLDINTITLALWIIGTLLGIVITLAFAGTEMRAQWLRAMMERLPVR